MAEVIEDTKAALADVSAYDLSRISRRDVLGKAFDFSNALSDAQRIQRFFNRIPLEYISELSSTYIQQVYNQSLAFLNILGQIQSFDPQADQNPAATRDNILNSLSGMYETVFNSLHPAVSFIAARQQDFSSLELEARSAAEAATRQANELALTMKANQAEAEKVLGAIRDVAAEQGVSQQAHYFKTTADGHGTSATTWERYTVRTAIGLGGYAFLTLLFAIFYIPESTISAAQMAVSKILIFAVIAYMLFHCSRTLIGHRHNEVINRHRENALLTFNSLVSAAGADDKRDVILTHAASCIFSPQETGYSKSSTNQAFPSVQIIEALPKMSQMGSSG